MERELAVPFTSHCEGSVGANSSPSPNRAARALPEEEDEEEEDKNTRRGNKEGTEEGKEEEEEEEEKAP